LAPHTLFLNFVKASLLRKKNFENVATEKKSARLSTHAEKETKKEARA
jgi:hypothetical protein